MTDENLSRQIDEIEALSAIYPDEWKTEDEAYRTYSAVVNESGKTATLLITLPVDYPASSPPFYLLTAPWMKDEDRDKIYSDLEQICEENKGENLLHLWIEKLREFLHTVPTSGQPDLDSQLDEEANQCQVMNPFEPKEECPLIISSESFADRKSTFQGHAAHITTVSQIKLVLDKLYENRKIAQATHNIYAYRIYNEDSKMWVQDCEDDGETHAGGRLLHLLQIVDVTNVVVVVSRWFGGILLGGDRFKHINNAARDALELGSFITSATIDEGKKKTKKGK